MGIPRFFSWLKSQEYPGVLLDKISEPIDWLIFDMNSLIHQAHQITYAYGERFTPYQAKKIRNMPPDRVEAEFHQTLIGLMVKVVRKIIPRKGILLAVDGVAPYAKIQQQRQRRYKSARTSEEETDPTIVDINRITPGTEFMFRLDTFLRGWIKNEKNRLGVEEVIYSSHLVPGEGEHKYLDLLRSGKIPSTGSQVIYGMDADLIILGLIAPVERVYIFREDDSNRDFIISLQNFRYSLQKIMKLPTFASDFALLTFFLGNDFLPHQPSLSSMKEGIQALLDSYLSTNLPLTNKTDGTILWDHLMIFLTTMSQKETSLLTRQAKMGFKYPSSALDQASQTISAQVDFTDIVEQSKALRTQHQARTTVTIDYQVFRSVWYYNTLGPRGDPEVLIRLFGPDSLIITTNQVEDLVIKYFRGLEWNLKYYLKGLKSTSSDYFFPYYSCPLFLDLISLPIKIRPYDGESTKITALHQLVAVMPFESINLLPLEVHSLLNVDSPIYDLFPNQFIIDREGTNYKWEGKPIIPFAEMDRIIEAVNETPFPPDKLYRYFDDQDLIITITKQAAEIQRKQFAQLDKVNRLFPRGRGNKIQTSTTPIPDWKSGANFL